MILYKITSTEYIITIVQAILNKQNILNIIGNTIFNNGVLIKDTINSLVTNNTNLGMSLDITKVTYSDAERVSKLVEKILYQNFNLKKITIIFTDSQGNQAKRLKNEKIIQKGKVVSIISGKGGVGKSTIATALSLKLHSEGYKVGIIDLDIYGPSVGLMLKVHQKPEMGNSLMVPILKHSIKCMSLDFLLKSNDAVAWRGPMVSKAVYQLLFCTLWGELDYLILDTPPGTGDVHLTLLEKYHIDDVIVVTTPHEASVSDASRTINLYNKFGANIVGVIENMSYFQDPVTGTQYKIFGSLGGGLLSKKYNLKLLSHIPIIQDLVINNDFQKIIGSTYIT